MTPPQEWVARPAPAQRGAKRIIGGFLSEVELWAREARGFLGKIFGFLNSRWTGRDELKESESFIIETVCDVLIYFQCLIRPWWRKYLPINMRANH